MTLYKESSSHFLTHMSLVQGSNSLPNIRHTKTLQQDSVNSNKQKHCVAFIISP